MSSRIAEKLCEQALRGGSVVARAEPLVVPYFQSEFNRCLNHAQLNAEVAGERRIAHKRWHALSLACRLNDMRKSEMGWHLTLFELFGQVIHAAPSSCDDVLTTLCHDIVTFLDEQCGIGPESLSITYFGGGRVLPGIDLPPDTLWPAAWRAAGVPDAALIPIPGPKLFILFVGPGERAGPKCEIEVDLSSRGMNRRTEVATGILDNAVVGKRHDSSWELKPALSPAAGVALGIERLRAIRDGAASLFETQPLQSSMTIVEEALPASVRAAQRWTGDARVLVDQCRAAAALLRSGVEPGLGVHGQSLLTMLRRVRRKLAILGIEDQQTQLLTRLETEIDSSVFAKHKHIFQSAPTSLPHAVKAIPWPEGWNPDSYCGCGGHG